MATIPANKMLYDIDVDNPTNIALYPVTITTTKQSYYTGYVKRAFIGSTFKMYSDAAGTKLLTRNKDYTLVQDDYDIEYSKLKGVSLYSSFKGTSALGTVYVTCDVVASYNSAKTLNEHELSILTLQENLATETTNRATNDNSLQAHINTEASSRETNDNILQANIDEEASTRATNDNTLQSNLNAHAALTDIHGATALSTSSRIMARDANGRTQVAAGAANLDAVNKQQMDAAIANVVATAGTGTVNPSTTGNVVGHVVTFANTAGTLIADGVYSIGNENTQIPISNLNVCTALNADMVDGYHANVEQANNTIVVRNSQGQIRANSVNAYNGVTIGALQTLANGDGIVFYCGNGSTNGASAITVHNRNGVLGFINGSGAGSGSDFATINTNGNFSGNAATATHTTGTTVFLSASATAAQVWAAFGSGLTYSYSATGAVSNSGVACPVYSVESTSSALTIRYVTASGSGASVTVYNGTGFGSAMYAMTVRY